jgi:hypothetical protein
MGPETCQGCFSRHRYGPFPHAARDRSRRDEGSSRLAAWHDLHGCRCSTRVRTEPEGQLEASAFPLISAHEPAVVLTASHRIQFRRKFSKAPPRPLPGRDGRRGCKFQGTYSLCLVGTRPDPLTEPPHRNCSSSMLTESSFAKSATTSTHGPSVTVKIDPQDNIWVADKGSDMVINGSTKLPARQKTNCTSPSC